MNKREIIDHIAGKFEMTKVRAEEVVQEVLDTCVGGALENGKVNFGAHQFERKTYKARTGTNPQTGEKIEIPAKVKIKYNRLNK